MAACTRVRRKTVPQLEQLWVDHIRFVRGAEWDGFDDPVSTFPPDYVFYQNWYDHSLFVSCFRQGVATLGLIPDFQKAQIFLQNADVIVDYQSKISAAIRPFFVQRFSFASFLTTRLQRRLDNDHQGLWRCGRVGS